jgi:hypothetical protein
MLFSKLTSTSSAGDPLEEGRPRHRWYSLMGQEMLGEDLTEDRLKTR